PGAPAPSILRLCDRDDAIHVVQSFSKSYCMTGWRVGWLVTRADAGSKLGQLNEFYVSHAATFAQVAAQTALEQGEEWLRSMVEGRVALVTGGARGIGFAIAQRFAEEGASVAVLALHADSAERAAGALGGGALAIAGDVSDEDDVRRAVESTVAGFGRLDVMV